MTLHGMLPLRWHARAVQLAQRWASGGAIVGGFNHPPGRYRVEQTTSKGGTPMWGIYLIDGSVWQ